MAGDVIGNTTNSDVAGDPNHRHYDLTVDSTSGLYVTGDVEVGYLTVNGHIEANHYYIRGGEVNSTRTLIALGNITVYGGTLTIGSTGAGSATVNGVISGTGSVTVGSGTVAGTLTLTRSASIGTTASPIGNVTVGTNGVISQPNGVTHNLVSSGNVVISGDVSIPGTIVVNTAGGNRVTLNSTGNLTVTSTPAGLVNNGGELIVVGGGTNVPTTPTGTGLDTVRVKGQSVSLNHSTRTGSITLTYNIAQDTTVAKVTATANTGYTATVTLTGNDGVNDNGALSVGTHVIYVDAINTADATDRQTYTITVTVLAASATSTVSVNATNAEVAVTGGQAASTPNTYYVPAGANLYFTVTANDGYTVSPDAVTYNVSSDDTTVAVQKAQDQGNNTYMIPSNHVTGTVTINVTGTLTPASANVTLKTGVYTVSGGVVDMSYNGNGQYTALVEEMPTEANVSNYVKVASGSTYSSSRANYDYVNGRDTNVYTVTYVGTNANGDTQYDQTITVTFELLSAAEQLSLDVAAVREALTGMSINTIIYAGAGDDTVQNPTFSVSRDLAAAIEGELAGVTVWGSVVDVTSATVPNTWNTNDTGSVTVNVTISLTNGKETDTIRGDFTMTLGPNA